jgi:hypothetical protein
MEFIGSLFVGVLVIGFVALSLGLVVFLFSIMAGGTSSTVTPSGGSGNSSMNEGDFHSGPEGYSPNTAYPDTFYGSGGHDEGDFNR